MDIFKVSVLFATGVNATIDNESIISDFDSLNWRFINQFCAVLINFLEENNCEVIESLNEIILLSPNKTNIVGGLNFSVQCSLLTFNKLINSFLSTIIQDPTKKTILSRNDVGRSIYEFLLKHSSRPIKNPLKLVFESYSYQIYGSFAKLEIPLDDSYEEKVFEVSGQIENVHYKKGFFQLDAEDGSTIGRVLYHYDFHSMLCDIYKYRSIGRFTLSMKSNAKGKVVQTLVKCQ